MIKRHFKHESSGYSFGGLKALVQNTLWALVSSHHLMHTT